MKYTVALIAGLLLAGPMNAVAGWKWTEVDSVFNTFGIETHPGFIYVDDLEDDGDPDIMFGGMGYTDSLDILLYRNIGSGTAPRFMFDAAYFGTMRAAYPRLADLDGDSLDEFIADSVIYRNTGTVSHPIWIRFAGFGDVGLDSCLAPWFADFDSDGDLDAVSWTGYNGPGRLRLYKNIGSVHDFAVIETTLALFDTIFNDWVHADNAPFCVDIDHDGDQDIVFSSIMLDTEGMNCKVIYNNGGWEFRYDPGEYRNLSHWGGGNICPYMAAGDSGASIFEVTARDIRMYPYESLPDTLDYLGSGIRLSPQRYEGYAAPAAYDADDDGDIDLIISDYSAPGGVFVSFPAMLRLDGMTNDTYNGVAYWRPGASVPTARRYNVTPAPCLPVSFCDWKGDGEEDLMYSAQWNIEVYADTGAGAVTRWAPLSGLFDYFDSLNVHDPNAGDLNGDGSNDMFVRTGSAYEWYRNAGTDSEPVWTPESGWGVFPDSGYTKAVLADIDDNSLTDIVFGMDDGTLICYRNTGTVSSPSWAVDPSVFAGIDVGENCAPCFVDYDKDGDLDMITGNGAGELAYYSNESQVPEHGWRDYSNYYPAAVGNTWNYDYYCTSTGSYSHGLPESRSAGRLARTILSRENTGDTVVVQFSDTLLVHTKTFYQNGDSVISTEFTITDTVEKFITGNCLIRMNKPELYFDSLRQCGVQAFSNRLCICMETDLYQEMFINGIGWGGYSEDYFSSFGNRQTSVVLNKAVINDSLFVARNDSLVYVESPVVRHSFLPLDTGNTWLYSISDYMDFNGGYSYTLTGSAKLEVTSMNLDSDTAYITFLDSVWKDGTGTDEDTLQSVRQFSAVMVGDEYIVWNNRDGDAGHQHYADTVYFDSLQVSDAGNYQLLYGEGAEEAAIGSDHYIRNIGWAGYHGRFYSVLGNSLETRTLTKAVIGDSTFVMKNDSLVYTDIAYPVPSAPLVNGLQLLKNGIYSLDGTLLPAVPARGIYIRVRYDDAGNVEIRKVFR